MDEQELLLSFERDMKELFTCCDFVKDGERAEIKCKLGLWSVSGPLKGMRL